MVNVRCDEEEDEDYEVRKIAARVMAKAPGRQPETKREGFGSKIAQDIYDELEMEVNYVMEARGWAREAQTDSIEVCVHKLAEDQGVEVKDHVQATMDLLRDTIVYKKAEGRISAEKKRRAAVEEAKRRALELEAPPPAPAEPDEPPSPPTPPGRKVSLKEAQRLYADYKKAEMGKLRKANPGKGPSDLRDIIYQSWQGSDENPKNCRGKWAALAAPSPAPAFDAADVIAPVDDEEPTVEWVDESDAAD